MKLKQHNGPALSTAARQVLNVESTPVIMSLYCAAHYCATQGLSCTNLQVLMESKLRHHRLCHAGKEKDEQLPEAEQRCPFSANWH